MSSCRATNAKAMVAPFIREAYAKGRADERAAIVAWLREDGPSWWCNVHMVRADEIEAGEHER